MGRRKYKPEQIVEAINAAGGVVAAAARMLGCDRSTIYRCAKEDAAVMDALEEANQVSLDLGEATLIDFVRGHQVVEIDGEQTAKPLDARTHLDAVKFYLRTKGRARGYGDRLDYSSTHPQPPHSIKIQVVNKPRDDGGSG